MQINQPKPSSSESSDYPISRATIVKCATVFAYITWGMIAVMVLVLLGVNQFRGFNPDKMLGAAIYDLFMLIPLVVIGILHTVRCRRTPVNKKSIIAVWFMLASVWLVVVWLANYESVDWLVSLSHWCRAYLDLNFVDALKNIATISNYTPLYNYCLIIMTRIFSLQGCLYAVKYLSFLFSLAMAVAMELIICHIRQTKFSYLHLTLFLLLPVVLLEFAAWGQCDMIYTTFCLFAFYYALKHRSVLCFVNLGLAFALKFQFLFIVPMIFVMLLIRDSDGKKYLSWKWVWIAPLMYVINLLPLLVGAPFLDLIMIYFRQIGEHGLLSSNCLNFALLFNWLSFTDNHTVMNVATIVLAVLGIAVTLWVLIMVLRAHRRQPLTQTDLVRYAMVFALVMVYFMPKMHERFYFVAVILAWVLALVQPSRGNQAMASLQTFALMTSMFIYLISSMFLDLYDWVEAVSQVLASLICGLGWLIITMVVIAVLHELRRSATVKFDETKLPR